MMRIADAIRILTVFASALCWGQSEAQVFFGPESFTPARAGIGGADSADFDGDGHRDVAVAAYNNGVVSVFRGRGDGTFHPAVEYSVGSEPSDTVAADLNEDGCVDLAVSDVGSGDVSVLLNDGLGSFESARRFPIGSDPGSIIAADLDGDGHLDVGASSYSEFSVSLVIGDGIGGFSAPRTFEIDSACEGGIGGLAAEDFNGDGFIDIAVGCVNGFVLWGDGSGNFIPRVADFVGYWPIAADLSRDGRLELVTMGGSAIYVFENDGAGGFARLWFWEIVHGASPVNVAIADFDEDGLGDISIACVAAYGGSFGVFALALTDAESGRWWDTYWYGRSVGFSDTLPGDYDEDGHIDIALTEHDSIVAHANITFDRLESLKGNVNATTGSVTPVLFLNESSGTGRFRPIELSPVDSLVVEIASPPSRPRARFVLYAWAVPEYEEIPYSFRVLPYGIGVSALPTPLTPGSGPEPRRIANNVGFEARLGRDDWPGPPLPPAPAVALDLPGGLGKRARLFLQGLILDSAAPNGTAAITNGIDARIR